MNLRGYRSYLINFLDEEEIKKLPRAFDVIGDVAIIGLSAQQEVYLPLITQAIQKIHPSIMKVLVKKPVSGTNRLREIAETIEVEYHENNMTFYVLVGQVFFSPRLAHERQRIMMLVKPHETVIDLFAGVGPFGLLCAKHCKFVYLCDHNPVAIRLLYRNAEKNKLTNIKIVEDDAKNFIRCFPSCSRIIMNLPQEAEQFLAEVHKHTSPGTIIHLYRLMENNELSWSPKGFLVHDRHHCFSYAKTQNVWCYDLERI